MSSICGGLLVKLEDITNCWDICFKLEEIDLKKNTNLSSEEDLEKTDLLLSEQP